MTERKFDWHLFIGALGIIVTLGSIIFGCYFSLLKDISNIRDDLSDIRKELVKIETVLILKGVAPPELFAAEAK